MSGADVEGLREAVADALMVSWRNQSKLEPPFETDRADAEQDADAVLAVVRPLLDAITAEREQYAGQLAACPQSIEGHSCCDCPDPQVAVLTADLDVEIGNRDRNEEWADRLAYAIAPQEVLGEHSSANDPWQNALDYLDSHGTVAALTEQRDEWERGYTDSLLTEVAALREQGAEIGASLAEAARRFEPSPYSAGFQAALDIVRDYTEVNRHALDSTERPPDRLAALRAQIGVEWGNGLITDEAAERLTALGGGE